MPRKKNATNEVRDLKKQVTQLQKELANLEARYLADIEAAAEAGYELGVIEAQEKELQREQVIADAVFTFEKAYHSKSPAKTVAKPAAKRRGRPAQAKKRVKRAKKTPAAAVSAPTVAELPAAPVPETAEPESESESETMH